MKNTATTQAKPVNTENKSSWIQRLSIRAFENTMNSIAWLGSVHPGADPEVYGVDVIRDVHYLSDRDDAHTLDVYLPQNRQGRLPVVLYAHGGGFRLLSKKTHWMMAIAFARQGYVVFNINYRLAPKHPFPAALEDVSDAYLWVVNHAHEFNGDASEIVVAGESAGANLVTALAIETTFERPEPWAKRVFETGVVPKAVVGYCGIYEVSNIDRLLAGRNYPKVVRDWVQDIETGYLGRHGRVETDNSLANPVSILEGPAQPSRELPSFFLSVGSDDALVDDTHRLSRALDKRRVDNQINIYRKEGHAFHMMTWRREAKRSWQDTYSFLRRVVPSKRTTVLRYKPRPFNMEWAREQILNVFAA